MKCDGADGTCGENAAISIMVKPKNALVDLCWGCLMEAIEEWTDRSDEFRDALRDSIFAGALGEEFESEFEMEVDQAAQDRLPPGA